MKTAHCLVTASSAMLLAMTAATPALAHGGEGTLILMNIAMFGWKILKLAGFALASVVGFVVVYSIIHFTWWRIRVRSGNKEDVNVIIVCLMAGLCVIAADAVIIKLYFLDK